MAAFIAAEIENFNLEFIELIKKHPCIWKKDAPDYSQKQELTKAWSAIAKEIGDSAKTCSIHWQKIRTAYARSFKINSHGSYYLSNALKFVLPYLKIDGPHMVESENNETVAHHAGDPHMSCSEIVIKEETVGNENMEGIVFEIIKMENENITDSSDCDQHMYTSIIISDDEIETNSVIELEEEIPANKERRENDSKLNKNSFDGNDEKTDAFPGLSLINANRTFFESLIPFVEDMNPQQNRRFRREMMCLIDDVLDDKDLED